MTRTRRENRLEDFVRVHHQFTRSVNLERDTAVLGAANYIPAGRALDVLRRLLGAMQDGTTTRSWSITGPYGCGKSSFALFLDALTGPSRDPLRVAAETALADADPDLLSQFASARQAFGVGESGFVRALVTAQRESSSATILRALQVGARRYFHHRKWPTGLKSYVDALIASVEAGASISVAEIAAIVDELAGHAPVLLVIDEFGKNLEHFAESPDAGDLFVLQAVAERVSGQRGAKALFLTLQHLAFDEYTTLAPTSVRKELLKVQGRFEDVPFIDSPAAAARLIRKTITPGPRSTELDQRIGDYGRKAYKECARFELTSLLGNDEDLIAGCYPVHPISLLILPELCSRYGQHQRTMFSFLSSREPGSVRSFTESMPVAVTGPLPIVTCDLIYDYFVESAGSMTSAAADSSRWMEVERRIRDAQGIDADEVRCLKAVGLLNLVASGGALRATPELIAFALLPPGTSSRDRGMVLARLRSLEERGFLVYRSFSDEYRIWQGSGFDIAGHTKRAREELDKEPVSIVCDRLNPLAPVVAARHSQETGVLRYFRRLLADRHGLSGDLLPNADGSIVYVVDDNADAALASLSPDVRPVVVVRSPDYQKVVGAALDAAAVVEVLNHPEVRDDYVAKRELQERAALAMEFLRDTFDDVFSVIRGGSTWTLSRPRLPIKERTSLSRLLSDVCDRVYADSPVVRNEMIARQELTSQGAKARRELVEAMIQHQAEPQLGIEGYGPDRAIYEGILADSGLHRAKSDGRFEFGPPKRKNRYGATWRAINDMLDEAVGEGVTAAQIADRLKAPPFGLKDGLIPVLLTAVLLRRADDVAVYQDGTYQTELTPDVIERLVKIPERFSCRSFALRGSRQLILRALENAFEGSGERRLRPRNGTILTILAPILDVVRSLPAYTLKTGALTETTLAVRDALFEAREPDDLLFVALPNACGLPRFKQRAAINASQARDYAERLVSALAELRDAYPVLIAKLSELLSFHLGIPSHLDLRADLRARAQRLAPGVLDKRLKSFLWIAVDTELDNEDWIEAVAVNLTERPPTQWRDEDLMRFETLLRDVAGTFTRVEALHFEHKQAQREGFDAKRISVTAANGVEVNRLVWIDDRMASALEDVIHHAITESERRVGRYGREALIALLAEKLYGEAERNEADESLSPVLTREDMDTDNVAKQDHG